ncbi:MAG: helix-turn-helix domain-containing protein [Planctomycetia bacterium]|nr:helix-turn-helix domain-containing protein [Planctomycetia bacterium]
MSAIETADAKTPRFVTVQEAARTLAVCDKTILRMIKSKDIVSIKVGNRWRVNIDDFLKKGVR